MNDQEIESEIQTKGLTAPRVSLSDVEENILSEFFFTAAQGADGAAGYQQDAVQGCIGYDHLRLLTFCVLVLNNGFTVTGESACASPENFDAELGRKIARQNAVQKLWPLMGYVLKQRIHEASEG